MKRNFAVPCTARNKRAALVRSHTPHCQSPRHSSFDTVTSWFCQTKSGYTAEAVLKLSILLPPPLHFPVCDLQVCVTTPCWWVCFLIPGQTPGLTCQVTKHVN